jgi:hypothetical protein
MSTITEVFKNKEQRDERLNELRAKGHKPDKTSTQVPVRWEMRYELRYSPEMRKRKKP